MNPMWVVLPWALSTGIFVTMVMLGIYRAGYVNGVRATRNHRSRRSTVTGPDFGCTLHEGKDERP